MAVHNWIDELVDRWATLTDGERTVRSFWIYDGNELPDELPMDSVPLAITRVERTTGIYSANASYEFTQGVTEFHLSRTDNPELYGKVLEWIPIVRNKLYGSITLGGLINDIRIVGGEGEGGGIEGPVKLQYNEEAPHWGLVLNWRAKEDVSADVTVAA